jgi:1,5-anhydro-D-fructose reductase (1,5-anhydro-D-mannitol-forming)
MRWGLIGTSGIAARAFVPAFEKAEGAELLAALGSDGEGARSFADEQGLETGTADLGEFLSAPGLEAVWIASPTFLHHEQGRAALEAGKHVLLEKPLAMTPGEGWGLVETARQAGRVLATGYQARYVPGHIAMRRLIAEGAVGEVGVASTYYGIHRPGPPPEWRRQRDTARWGALADVGTHHVDLLRMLLGETAEGHAYAGRHLGFETDDVVSATLRFESGALASLAMSTNVWTQHTRVAIHGTEGALVATDTSPLGQGEVTLLRPEREPEDVTGERPVSWVAQLETVTRAASGEDVDYATGEDGARNLEILAQLVP